MIYSKLPVVFLTTLASEKNGSTNSTIASYILDHLNDMENISIKELAKKCNVAVSSISRFCKEIGLRDFAELKELLNFPDLSFEMQSQMQSFPERIQDYRQKVVDSISMVADTISEKQVVQLCHDIRNYQQVAIFGLLKAGAVALNLQSDLLMLGKKVNTNISYQEQMQYIFNAHEDDLIIIFSYTASYFDYQDLRAMKKKLYAPKIWMISSQEDSYPDFVDEVITFRSLQDQGSHPYQLQFVASLIGQEYARIYQ